MKNFKQKPLALAITMVIVNYSRMAVPEEHVLIRDKEKVPKHNPKDKQVSGNVRTQNQRLKNKINRSGTRHH